MDGPAPGEAPPFDPVTPASGVTGMIDGVSRVGLYGWLRAGDAPVEVVILVDGVERARRMADVVRADLVDAGVGDGRYGFEASFVPPLSPGPHRVDVVRAADGVPHPDSPVELAPATDVLRGHIDSLSRLGVRGWARDTAAPEVPVDIVVSVDGAVVERVLANTYRADLEQAGIGDGRHGFEVLFEPPLSTLRHVIAIVREADGAPVPRSPLLLDDPAQFDAAVQDGIAAALDSAETDADLRDRVLFLATQMRRLLQRRSDRASLRGERVAARQMRRRWAGEAEDRGPQLAPRALVVDVRLPRLGRDAGSSAVISHARSLQRLGHEVVLAGADMAAEGASALESLGLACCHTPWFGALEEVLRAEAQGFDLVYLHRVECAFPYLALVRANMPRARVVFSVADLQHVRLSRQAAAEKRPELEEIARRVRNQELWSAMSADAVITHSSEEAKILRQALPNLRVHVVPWAVPPRPSAPAFKDRHGLAFIGGYAHPPNLDAALWLVEDIMPRLLTLDPAAECLIVGTDMPEALRTERPGVVPMGELPSLDPVFDRVRMTVAPLAYGAGLKGKVLESLAAGVPCVCTPVAAEGIALGAGLRSLVAADESGLAASIHRLHEDRALWAQCREEGLEYVTANLGESRIDELLRGSIA